VNKKNTIKKIYKLKYEKSDFNSGLVRWYNHLLDKSIEELNETDVSKMIRQDILKCVAIDRAIELFDKNPIIGEMYSGDILYMLIKLIREKEVSGLQLNKIMNTIIRAKENLNEFEWDDNEAKDKFIQNINIINKI